VDDQCIKLAGSTVEDIVNLVDRRRFTPTFIELTTRFDDQRAMAKFCKFRVYDKLPFCLNFLKTVVEKPQNSSIRPDVSTEHRLVTDGQTQTSRGP